MINRVGDFGFLLGIGLVLAYFGGSLRYQDVFAYLPNVQNATIQLFPGVEWSLITVTCLLLFVGAMGKSAQFPLHVWLPDSMEGPTPISALIHAATMVTAGLFMVSRMSPIYEMSSTALSVIMVIGAITALFMGFLGVIQNDILRPFWSTTKPWVSSCLYGARPIDEAQPVNIDDWNQPRCWSLPSRYKSAGHSSSSRCFKTE